MIVVYRTNYELVEKIEEEIEEMMIEEQLFFI